MNPLETLTRACLRRPLVTLLGAALLTAGLAAGIPRVQRETALRTFLGERHPTVLALDRHLERFGGGYPVFIAWSCRESPHCTSALEPASLAVARDVARALERVPGVRAVHGPATTPLLLPWGDDFLVKRLDEADAEPAVPRAELVRAAGSDPLWARTLLSRDGRAAAVVVDVVTSDAEAQHTISRAVEDALAPHRAAGWRFHLVGELVDFVYSGPELERASQAMVPVMSAVLVVALGVLLRSAALTLATVATMGLAFVWTQGAMGWAGIRLNALTTVTPSLVFAIGILDGVHVVSHYRRRVWREGEGAERRALLAATAREVGPACLYTSLTTGGAFLAFTASGIASFAEFGVAAAWGIASALALSFSVLPVALATLPASRLGARHAEPAWEGLLDAVLALVHRRAGAVLAVAALLTAVGAAGMAQLRVEVHPEQIMGETNRVMVWNRWLRDNLRETESLEVALALPEGASFKDPAVLRELDAVATWLGARERLHHPRSVLEPLRHLNQVAHGGDPAWYRTEPSRAHNAQLALLLAMNDPLQVEQWVHAGDAAANGSGEVLRVSVEAESMSTSFQEALVADVRRHLDASLPPGWSYELTGSLPVYLDMMGALQRHQLVCFGIATLAALGLMSRFLRSPRAALVALVPSVVPIVVTLGLLGWWGVGLDPGSTMVATIIVGVAVDDGIHLLWRFRRERHDGAPVEDAVDAALRHVGTAVVASSLVLAAAFWALTVSPVSSVASFGFLAGVAILAALAADLLILPALLLRGAGALLYAPAASASPGAGEATP